MQCPACNAEVNFKFVEKERCPACDSEIRVIKNFAYYYFSNTIPYALFVFALYEFGPIGLLAIFSFPLVWFFEGYGDANRWFFVGLKAVPKANQLHLSDLLGKVIYTGLILGITISLIRSDQAPDLTPLNFALGFLLHFLFTLLFYKLDTIGAVPIIKVVDLKS